jgi:hypothetical protein
LMPDTRAQVVCDKRSADRASSPLRVDLSHVDHQSPAIGQERCSMAILIATAHF